MSNTTTDKVEQLQQTCFTHFEGAAVLLNMGDHALCESAARLLHNGVTEINVQLKTLSKVDEEKDQKIKFQEAAIAKLQCRIKELEARFPDQELAGPTADASEASLNAVDNKITALPAAAESTSDASFNNAVDSNITDLTFHLAKHSTTTTVLKRKNTTPLGELDDSKPAKLHVPGKS